MDERNIVAVYASRAEAERVRDRLIEVGIPATDIRVSGAESVDRAMVAETDTVAAHREGFWDWLFGRDVPEHDRSWYETNLREGRTVVSVIVSDIAERHRAAEILEDFNPIDFEESESRYRGIESPPATETAAARIRPETVPNVRPATDTSLGSPQTWERDRDMASAAAAARDGEPLAGGSREVMGSEENVIPVVKEDIAVGKRMHERRYRIRTYTVETPVEREVTLRDERVVIEHRPVSDQAAAARVASEMPKDRDYEIIERHEEPVVEKRREVEEVVVHKEAEDRTERVRDTVRETRVDIDRDAGAGIEKLEPAAPEERKP